jgi:DNA (cytosine-5)-methyltransferase 1
MTTAARQRPRLLDLFCGAGGASAGYHAAGFDVTGVDHRPQPDYPFPFILADAVDLDVAFLAGFDIVHASPPCQAFSQATPTTRRAHHPDLIEPVRTRLVDALTSPGGRLWAYVIENVPGAPLLDPVTLCGDSLRLGVRRHRLFESNLPLTGTPCWHDRPTPPIPVYGSYGQRGSTGRKPLDAVASPGTDAARTAMGIDWMPWPALTQAIPPTYTHWLGVQLHTHRPTHPDPGGGDATTAGQPSPTLRRAQGLRHANDQQDETRRRDPTAQVPSVTAADTTPPAAFRHCRCGQPLPTRPATGRWPRHCSHACRQAAYRARHHINALTGGPTR